MSNETMTDALRALDLIYHEVCDTKQTRDAYEFLAARLRGEAAPDSVRSLSAKWRALAESKGYRGITHADIGNVEAACLVVSANELEAAPAAPDITTDLDFEPDEHHTVADMANVGYSLMQAIKSNRPDYCWNESPAEIVVTLINERDEAAGIVPGCSAAPAPVAGDAVAELPAKWEESIVSAGVLNPQDLRPMRFVEDLRAALAQDRASQAAAPSAPVGVDGLAERAAQLYEAATSAGATHEQALHEAIEHALAQQPGTEGRSDG